MKTSATKNNIKVALIQHSVSNSADQNLETIQLGLQQAAAAESQLCLLQELPKYRYFCQHEADINFNLAESVPGPTSDWLGTLAKQHSMVIVGSVFEKDISGQYHNTAVVMETDGSLAGCYRKMHIPEAPGYYEKYYFAPGDLGFKPIQTSVARLGVLICWDQWFPEAARLMALAGAELLLYPTAIGWEPSDSDDEKLRQHQAWKTIQQSHSIANCLPLLCCNRTGHEAVAHSQIDFWGTSFVTDSFGKIIASATSHEDCVLLAEIDLSETRTTRVTWPFFRDRRIDSYNGLLKRSLDKFR